MDYDIRLIEEVRKYPVIYDNSDRRFKDNQLKHVIWSRITYCLRRERRETSVKLVKMRWKSLRDSYVKELKHRLANDASNSSSSKPKKNWRYTKHMEFLKPYLGFQTDGSLNMSLGKWPKSLLDNSGSAMESLETTLAMEDAKEDGLMYLGPSISVSRYREHFLSELLDSRNPIKTQVKIEEEEEIDIDMFFKGIAETVKTLHPLNQVKLQRAIVNLVLDVKHDEIKRS